MRQYVGLAFLVFVIVVFLTIASLFFSPREEGGEKMLIGTTPCLNCGCYREIHNGEKIHCADCGVSKPYKQFPRPRQEVPYQHEHYPRQIEGQVV